MVHKIYKWPKFSRSIHMTPEFQSQPLPVLNKHKMEGTAGTAGTGIVSPVRSSCRNSADAEGMLPGNRVGDWGTLDMAKAWQKL